MKIRMTTKNYTRWIANNLKTNPVHKIVSGLVLGALLIMGATMAFGSSHVESLGYSASVDNIAQSPESQPLPYFEETLEYRDQRHQRRVAAAEAKEATIALNEQMPYFEETLYNRDQRHQRRVAEAEAKEATLVLNEQMPYFEETLFNRDQRHQRRVAEAKPKEATIFLNEQMPYFDETLYNRDQQWERRNPTTGSTGR